MQKRELNMFVGFFIVVFFMSMLMLVGWSIVDAPQQDTYYEECDCNNLTTDMCITICTGDADVFQNDEADDAYIYEEGDR